MTQTPGISVAVRRVAAIKCVFGYLLPTLTFLLFVPGMLAIAGERAAPASKRAGGIIFMLLLVFLVWRLTKTWRHHFWNLRKASQWGLGLWRVKPFAARMFENRATMEKAARSLDTDALYGCYHCPDHTEAAKTIIKAELASRGVDESTLQHWSPPPSAMTVPNAAFRSNSKTSEASAATVTMFMLTRLVVAVGLVAAINAALAVSPVNFYLYRAGLLSDADSRWWWALAGPSFWTLLTCLLLFFVVLLPIGAVAAGSNPVRILLLRPFDQRAMTKALKRIVLRYLGLRGHVFTLSDPNYKPNPFVRIADLFASGGRYAVAPIVRPSLRLATVTNERSWLKLAVSLSRRLGLGARSFITGGQALNIKSTFPWWQRCIHMLMHSSQIIVMDVSRVSTGSAWEIEQLGERGLLDRAVFIVQERYAAESLQGINNLLPPGFTPKVHVFRETGEFLDPVAFKAALADILREGSAHPR